MVVYQLLLNNVKERQKQRGERERERKKSIVTQQYIELCATLYVTNMSG